MRSARLRWLVVVVVIGLALILVPRFLVPTRFANPTLESRGRADTLVVAVHGLTGAASLNGLKDLVRRTRPDADLIAPSFPSHPLSNVDAYEFANTLEAEIHAAYEQNKYQIVGDGLRQEPASLRTGA